MMYFILGVICIFSAVGGIETLPADAGVIEWLQPIMIFALGIVLGLFGIDKFKATA
jgi:hypothetical protein